MIHNVQITVQFFLLFSFKNHHHFWTEREREREKYFQNDIDFEWQINFVLFFFSSKWWFHSKTKQKKQPNNWKILKIIINTHTQRERGNQSIDSIRFDKMWTETNENQTTKNFWQESQCWTKNIVDDVYHHRRWWWKLWRWQFDGSGSSFIFVFFHFFSKKFQKTHNTIWSVWMVRLIDFCFNEWKKKKEIPEKFTCHPFS